MEIEINNDINAEYVSDSLYMILLQLREIIILTNPSIYYLINLIIIIALFIEIPIIKYCSIIYYLLIFKIFTNFFLAKIIRYIRNSSTEYRDLLVSTCVYFTAMILNMIWSIFVPIILKYRSYNFKKSKDMLILVITIYIIDLFIYVIHFITIICTRNSENRNILLNILFNRNNRLSIIDNIPT